MKRAGGDELRRKAVVLGLAAVAPVDVARLGQRGHLGDPVDQLGVADVRRVARRSVRRGRFVGRCSHEGLEGNRDSRARRCAAGGASRPGRTASVGRRPVRGSGRRFATRGAMSPAAQVCACSRVAASVARGADARAGRPSDPGAAAIMRRMPTPPPLRRRPGDAALAARRWPQKPSERGGSAAPRRRPRARRFGPGRSLQRAFGADTGIAVLLVAGPGAGGARGGQERRDRRRSRQRARRRGRRSRSRASSTTGGRSPRASSSSSARRRRGCAGACRRRAEARVEVLERMRDPGRDRPGERRLPLRRRRFGRRTSPSRRSGARPGSSRSRRGT